MTLSQAASLFNVSTVVVVLLISAWVVRRHPRPFFTQWVIGYGVGAVLMALEWIASLTGRPFPLAHVGLVLMPTAAWFFFQSGNHLRGRPLGVRTYLVLLAALFGAGAAVLAAGGPFPLALTPSLFAFSAALVYLGVMIIRHMSSTHAPSGSWYLGVAVALLGIQPLGYPLLESWGVDWLGFWISGVMHMLVGSGMIIFLLEEFSAQLQGQNERLRELDELKSRFVSTVSHELRTPLTSIVGYLELLEDGVGGGLAPLQLEYVATMRSSAGHLSGLVDTILDSMRLQRGALSIRRERVDVVPVVEEALDSLRAVADRKRVGLRATMPDALPLVEADAVRLTQVLHNLVGNALKFTPEGGRVEVACEAPEALPGRVRVRVVDTGIGIPADQLDRVFEPFYQVDASLTREHGGTGLGLSIVREMLQAMGGELGVTSTPGEGSEFWFTLAVAAEAGVEATAVLPAADPSPSVT